MTSTSRLQQHLLTSSRMTFFASLGLAPANRIAETIIQLGQYKGERVSELTLTDKFGKLNRLYDDLEDDRIRMLRPLKTFCLKLLEAGHQFTAAHITFLKVVIETRMYKQAVEVLEWPLIQTDDMKSDEILEYLYYAGIVWTALEEYKQAANAFGFINRLEERESNIKIDAKKKLNLVKLLLGQRVSERERSAEYAPIIAKLQRKEGLTKEEEALVKQDGNSSLILKLKDTFLMKELTDNAYIYNRIPITSLDPIYAQPETIAKINKLQHTYRYDPKSSCVIFESQKTNLEKTISKSVKTYLQILAEEKNFKMHEQKQREQLF